MCVPVHVGCLGHRRRRTAGGVRGVPHRAGGQRARARRQGGARSVDVCLTVTREVGRFAGNGCPAQLPRSCPAGRAGFGSPCPWPVAVPGARRSVIECGLVGSSHDAILWSRACHTFPSPRLMTLGASSDHGGGGLVSGDVFIWGAPVLVSPRAAVGGRRYPDA